MMVRSRILLLMLGIVCSSSCSFVDRFDDFHATDGGGQLTAANFLPRFFDGLCQKSIRCETKLGIGALLQLTCHPDIRQVFLTNAFGSIGDFDPVQAQECLDGLNSIDCSISNTLFVSQCEQFLRGTLPTGAPCNSDINCAAGRCEQPVGGCREVCVDKAGAGEACTQPHSDDECDAQLRCRSGMCQLPGLLGQPCEDSSDCDSLLWCDASSTCQPLPNVGDTCVIDMSTDYADPCRGSLVCKLDNGGASRSCQAGGTAGLACDSASPCAPGHRCESSVCHLISADGGPCVSRADCPFMYECVSETCVPYGGIGDPCSPTLPCAQGACVDQVCTYLPDGSTCDGSNGLLGGQCQGYCTDLGGGIYVCAPRGGVGTACPGEFDDEACQTGLVCADQGAGIFTCSSCP